ncbi:MAG: amidinotransferase [Pirellulales bacterium]|nr:amidinotransferase [Pirellulales bacterium]
MPHPPRILMCPPDYYGIQYEINPWMSRRRPSDPESAARQWQALRGLIEGAGAAVACLDPVPGLPDMVFTANAAMIFSDQAILSRFRHPQRQGEEPHFQRWLSENGFQVERLAEDLFFEGAGDALFCGDTLFAGYRIRSDARAYEAVGDLLACRVIPLELVQKHFYHLDTCFCPLEPGRAIYYPPAFDHYGRHVLGELVPELIPVSDDEARHFACNAVVIGRTVVTNTGCPELHGKLRSLGFNPVETPLSEFLRAGGAAKCLTLRLDGEDAAAWKTSGMSPLPPGEG